jgi:hypothetical protein
MDNWHWTASSSRSTVGSLHRTAFCFLKAAAQSKAQHRNSLAGCYFSSILVVYISVSGSYQWRDVGPDPGEKTFPEINVSWPIAESWRCPPWRLGSSQGVSWGWKRHLPSHEYMHRTSYSMRSFSRIVAKSLEHCKWSAGRNLIYVFPEMKLLFPKQNNNVLSPSSYTHISVRDLFISSIFCCRKICGLILGIYKSLTDTWMWKWDWGNEIPRKGILNGISVAVRCVYCGSEAGRYEILEEPQHYHYCDIKLDQGRAFLHPWGEQTEWLLFRGFLCHPPISLISAMSFRC